MSKLALENIVGKGEKMQVAGLDPSSTRFFQRIPIVTGFIPLSLPTSLTVHCFKLVMQESIWWLGKAIVKCTGKKNSRKAHI